MGEKYGPLTYRQSLEEDFKQISPKCRCTQSNIARARGASYVANGIYPREQVEAGLEQVFEDCPTSKAVSMCCELVQKCTNVEFVEQGLGMVPEIVDTTVANVYTEARTES